jgi:hypothetical protein
LRGRYELLKLRNKETQEEGTLLKWMIDAMAQAAAYKTLSGSVDDPWGWYQNLINDIFDYGGLIPLTGGKYSLWGDKASMILMANPN